MKAIQGVAEHGLNNVETNTKLINKNIMIKEFVEKWEARKHELEEYFRTHDQNDYLEYVCIVKKLFDIVIDGFNPKKITVVDDGGCQGTQIFLIPRDTYQPSSEDYVFTHNYYGSCSGCDTLLAINGYCGGLPSEEQIREYMTLSLHLLQQLKWLDRGSCSPNGLIAESFHDWF